MLRAALCLGVIAPPPPNPELGFPPAGEDGGETAGASTLCAAEGAPALGAAEGAQAVRDAVRAFLSLPPDPAHECAPLGEGEGAPAGALWEWGKAATVVAAAAAPAAPPSVAAEEAAEAGAGAAAAAAAEVAAAAAAAAAASVPPAATPVMDTVSEASDKLSLDSNSGLRFLSRLPDEVFVKDLRRALFDLGVARHG
ncbi:unnamed protein product [Closterium sp. NIES-53]